MVGEVQSWKSQLPYWPDGWPTNWSKIIPKKFSHIVKVLNPMSVFPAWGSNKVTGNPQGIWPWKLAGLDYRTSTGLGEKTPVLQGTNKILCAPRPWGKEHWPHRRLNKTTCQCLRVSYRGVGWQRFTTGMGELAEAVLECSSWHKPSWRFPLTQP